MCVLGPGSWETPVFSILLSFFTISDNWWLESLMCLCKSLKRERLSWCSIAVVDAGLVSQGLFYLIVYNPSRREIREGTQGRDWNRGHGGGPLTGLLSMAQSWLSSTPRITCSGMAPLVVGWTLTRLSLIKKMPYILLYRLSWWRYFLSWGSLFPAYPSLCQVNKNQPTQEAETSTLFFIRFCYSFKNQNESYHTTSPNDLFHGTISPF